MRVILLAALLLLGACDPEPPVPSPAADRCNQYALLTYAAEISAKWGWTEIQTRKVCIVAIKPLER